MALSHTFAVATQQLSTTHTTTRNKLTKTFSLSGPFIAAAAVPNQAAPGLTFAVAAEQPTEVRLMRPLVLQGAGRLGDQQVGCCDPSRCCCSPRCNCMHCPFTHAQTHKRIHTNTQPHTHVIQSAVDLVTSDSPLHPDVRGAVYKLAIMSGKKEAFDKIWRLYNMVCALGACFCIV